METYLSMMGILNVEFSSCGEVICCYWNSAVYGTVDNGASRVDPLNSEIPDPTSGIESQHLRLGVWAQNRNFDLSAFCILRSSPLNMRKWL